MPPPRGAAQAPAAPRQQAPADPVPVDDDPPPPPDPAPVAPVVQLPDDVDQRLRQLRGSGRAFRAHITRISNLITGYTDNTPARRVTTLHPGQYIIQQLGKLENLRIKYEEIVGEQTVLDEANREYYEDTLPVIDDQCNPVVNGAHQWLGNIPPDWQPELPAPPAGGPALVGAVGGDIGGAKARLIAKANMVLKPEPLTLDNTPTEMKTWIMKFKAFVNTSNIHTLPYMDQQAYLLQFLSVPLHNRIWPKLQPDMPLFSDDPDEDTCMGILLSIFQERYPVYHRREIFFNAQFSGPISEIMSFIQKLENLAEAADLEALDMDSLIAYKGLSAVKDVELRRLCAREDVLTLQRFRQLALQRVREYTNLSGKDAAKTEKVAAVQGDRSNAQCFYCKRKGHWANDCQKKKREDSKKARKKSPQGAQKKKVHQVTDADAEPENDKEDASQVDEDEGSAKMPKAQSVSRVPNFQKPY